MGGDLYGSRRELHADRAETFPLSPNSVGQGGNDRFDGFGAGRGGEVYVGVGPEFPTKEQIAHDPSDQIKRVPGRGESVGQGPDLVEHRLHTGGDHAREARGTYGLFRHPLITGRGIFIIRALPNRLEGENLTEGGEPSLLYGDAEVFRIGRSL